MIRSMTGFGSASAQFEGKTITVDLRSVNSKFLDLNLKMPSAFRDKELELRSFLQKELERGKADLSVVLENDNAPKKVSIDKSLFIAYHKELVALGKELSLPSSDLTSAILRLPDVLAAEKSDAGEEEWQQIFGVIKLAVASFQQFRETEGKSQTTDLNLRIKAIENLLGDIEVYEPQRLEAIRQRLSGSLEEFIETNHIDRNRFEQELIFYIEKLDVSEEKVRLRSHCEFFVQTMNDAASSGKKLNFITQEIGREINTIGSKANHAGIQKLVVEMKDELEKVKEQLMNIL
jgi:uncharacterized protein (TIGR00255 family)